MREQQIEDIIWEEITKANKFVAHVDWSIPYRGWKISKSKRTYGSACEDGTLLISCIYLGTREFARLKDTIRHELAHLICGMDAGHNNKWRFMAQRLGCKPVTNVPLSGELIDKAKPKWRLIGILEDGTEVKFHACHTQQMKYLRPAKRSCAQGIIVKCKYVRNI